MNQMVRGEEKMKEFWKRTKAKSLRLRDLDYNNYKFSSKDLYLCFYELQKLEYHQQN